MSAVLPRDIRPELVEPGDTVRVVHTKRQGIEMVREGRVHTKEEHGQSRLMLTREGGLLFTWSPGVHHRYKLVLLKREPAKQEALF